MTEKRFSVDDDGIYDTQEKKHFKFVAYDWIDCDIYECCDLLNEQQATISQLQDLCGESDSENAKLRIENKQLRRLFEEMKQPITINLTEEDEKELRKLLGLIDDE